MTNPSGSTDPAAPPPMPPPTGSPSPTGAATEQAQVVYLAHTPRPGELSPGWRIVTLLTWILVILGFAAVWNTSTQLGLSTWWLGPRGQPRLRIVQLSPFVAPVLMVLAAINHVRWLGWWGLAAATVLAGYGIADLVSVTSLAALQLLIAGLAAAVSIASLTGTYRMAPVTNDRTDG